jgi:hypothetical protein
VRAIGRGKHIEHYVLCHNTCIRVYPTSSQLDQIMRVLAADAKAGAPLQPQPDQSEHDAAREAQDAYTIALQDAQADAEESASDYAERSAEARRVHDAVCAAQVAEAEADMAYDWEAARRLAADSALFSEDDLISVYTRAQAIEDGELVDVSAVAREAGFVYPVALTRAVWSLIENIPARLKGIEDLQGRLWDVLYMARLAARRGGSVTIYSLILNRVENGRARRNLQLKMHCGPGDQGDPVITISLPDED